MNEFDKCIADWAELVAGRDKEIDALQQRLVAVELERDDLRLLLNDSRKVREDYRTEIDTLKAELEASRELNRLNGEMLSDLNNQLTQAAALATYLNAHSEEHSLGVDQLLQVKSILAVTGATKENHA